MKLSSRNRTSSTIELWSVVKGVSLSFSLSYSFKVNYWIYIFFLVNVRGFPFNFTNKDLMDFFGKKGPRAIQILAGTGTARVTFHTIEDAAVACNLVMLLISVKGYVGIVIFFRTSQRLMTDLLRCCQWLQLWKMTGVSEKRSSIFFS